MYWRAQAWLFSFKNAIVEGTWGVFTARGAYKFMELGKENLTSVAPPPPASVLLSTETQQLVLIDPTRHSSVVRTPCFHCRGHSSIAAQGLRCPKWCGVAKKWKIMISQQRFIKGQLYIQHWMRFPKQGFETEWSIHSLNIHLSSNHPCILSVTPYPLISVIYELVCIFYCCITNFRRLLGLKTTIYWLVFL